jgi:hypothetical protein
VAEIMVALAHWSAVPTVTVTPALALDSPAEVTETLPAMRSAAQ